MINVCILLLGLFIMFLLNSKNFKGGASLGLDANESKLIQKNIKKSKKQIKVEQEEDDDDENLDFSMKNIVNYIDTNKNNKIDTDELINFNNDLYEYTSNQNNEDPVDADMGAEVDTNMGAEIDATMGAEIEGAPDVNIDMNPDVGPKAMNGGFLEGYDMNGNYSLF